jgi:hypothetical protein
VLARGRDPETGERYLGFPSTGVRLTEVLADRGVVPWAEWCTEIGRRILDTLTHGSQQIPTPRREPGNVLIEDGIARLADFGVAKLVCEVSVSFEAQRARLLPFRGVRA